MTAVKLGDELRGMRFVPNSRTSWRVVRSREREFIAAIDHHEMQKLGEQKCRALFEKRAKLYQLT